MSIQNYISLKNQVTLYMGSNTVVSKYLTSDSSNDFNKHPSSFLKNGYTLVSALLDAGATVSNQWSHGYDWLGIGVYGDQDSKFIRRDINEGVGVVKITEPLSPSLFSNNGKFNRVEFHPNRPSVSTTTTITHFRIYYNYLPYTLNTDISKGKGTIQLTEDSTSNNSVILTAIPADGYIFKQWSDGTTNPILHFNPDVTGTYEISAEFEKTTYKIYYHTIINGEDKIILEQECEGDTEYTFLNLPDLSNNILTGYLSNPTGWIEDTQFNNIVIRNNDLNMYTVDLANNISTQISQYSGVFTNFLNNEEETHLYTGVFPIQYAIYKKMYQGTKSNYSIDTQYRIYNNIEQCIFDPLQKPLYGYKLTNKMLFADGPEDSSRINNWFISDENMNPGDPTLSQINADYADDITVYSFETPIVYYYTFHVFNALNEEIYTSDPLKCYYGTSQNRLEALEELEGHTLKGWYGSPQDISNWYIDNSTLELMNGNEPLYSFGSSIGTSFSAIDQAQLNAYAYYIPYQFTIKYLWLDSYGTDSEEFNLPSLTRKYGQGEPIEIETIPSYPDNYIVENAGTKNWYYYKNNDETTEQLINDKEIIEITDLNDYVFYGRKSPLKRHITFSSQNEEYGTVTVLNPTEDELYEEGYIIEVQVNPTEIAYFSNWSDGNNSPNRQIVVGSSNMHYMAVFRSNQIYVGMLGILGGYKNTSKLKAIIPPNKIVEPRNSYSIENPYTYGFYLNNNGYYESNNKKISSSFAMCKVNIIAGKACKMYVDCINYAEGTWDYGMLSRINTTLSASNKADSSSYLQKSFSGSQSSYVQTVTYDIPAGNSYIYIKYRKDSSVDSNNDSLQFKIRFE